jgi:hypothetical protein
MSFAVDDALYEFQKINDAEGLSSEDKTRLKEAYLRNYFTPHAQEMLRLKLEHERATDAHWKQRREQWREKDRRRRQGGRPRPENPSASAPRSDHIR